MAENENKAYDYRHKVYGPAGLSRACGLFTVDIAEAPAAETPTEPEEETNTEETPE